MSRFASYDGTEIEFRRLGEGRPLVCLPGGPGRASEYLGDLGGLPGARQLVQADTRGTGASASADPSTYRCDRLVADVEALRAHLGLERFDLLGHSAAGDLALLYAAAHPGRIDHLILLTPGLQAVGVQATEEEERAAMKHRSGEPWYGDAVAAVQKAEAGQDSLENRSRYVPFYYGRWDEAAHMWRSKTLVKRPGLRRRRLPCAHRSAVLRPSWPRSRSRPAPPCGEPAG
jgi:proline iminopeptidase